MNINRQNYESFFLLYIDKELNMQQQQEVERFAEQNPDLATELQLLSNTRLPEYEEDIVFSRESLYRHETPETLLLYIDQELEAQAAVALEKELAQSAGLQQQLTQLRQTVLPAEVVVFEEKKKLYRHTGRRIMPWTLLAVAAALTGVVISGWWLFSSENSHTSGTTALVSPGAPGQKPGTITATAPASRQQEPAVVTTPSIPVVTVQASEALRRPVAVKQQAVTVASLPEQAPAVPDQQIAPVENNALLTAAATPHELPVNKAPITVAPQQAPVAAVNPPATSDIVYKELDTSEDPPALYVGVVELNKNKLNGFLKKAGRLLGGKARNPDHL